MLFCWLFQIPNLFRRLLGEGALTAAFIPIFKEKEKTEGNEAVWRSANAVVSGLLVVTAAIVVIAMLIISAVLAFGNIQDAGTVLMLRLLRVMFPYLFAGLVWRLCAWGCSTRRGHLLRPCIRLGNAEHCSHRLGVFPHSPLWHRKARADFWAGRRCIDRWPRASVVFSFHCFGVKDSAITGFRRGGMKLCDWSCGECCQP
jgi:hypothetical protein